ncbi:Hypothetical predicted protein [Cloeon dipterum]|uniref:ESCRT-I complex subunit MVB12A n=1 Tax=Cloeon dipterum TaxID=197152 RepID=A0A8S1CUD1_9INSE|nr:Hypothetical predicted protein [Cloeon dipterum]
MSPMLNLMDLKSLYSGLPDDRPITSIGVVEDSEKCPPDFYVVSRTHDQDSDADLWKDGFFGRKVTRYLCLSKKQGLPGLSDYIVESIAVVNDKEVPPDGYTLLPRTIDSEQKAWRKKQLCYRLSKRSLTSNLVTDVIVLSKMKKAPEGFTLAGEINGLTVCFKSVPNSVASTPNPSLSLTSLNSPINSYSNISAPATPRRKSNGHAPAPPTPGSEESMDDYVSLKPIRPPPPLPNHVSPVRNPMVRQSSKVVAAASRTYATLAAFQGLEGVPFIISPKLKAMADPASVPPTTVKTWTEYEIEREFSYDFRTERQTQQNSS